MSGIGKFMKDGKDKINDMHRDAKGKDWKTGIMSKAKPGASAAQDESSKVEARPLSSLQSASAFAPPPRHRTAHGLQQQQQPPPQPQYQQPPPQQPQQYQPQYQPQQPPPPPQPQQQQQGQFDQYGRPILYDAQGNIVPYDEYGRPMFNQAQPPQAPQQPPLPQPPQPQMQAPSYQHHEQFQQYQQQATPPAPAPASAPPAPPALPPRSETAQEPKAPLPDPTSFPPPPLMGNAAGKKWEGRNNEQANVSSSPAPATTTTAPFNTSLPDPSSFPPPPGHAPQPSNQGTPSSGQQSTQTAPPPPTPSRQVPLPPRLGSGATPPKPPSAAAQPQPGSRPAPPPPPPRAAQTQEEPVGKEAPPPPYEHAEPTRPEPTRQESVSSTSSQHNFAQEIANLRLNSTPQENTPVNPAAGKKKPPPVPPKKKPGLSKPSTPAASASTASTPPPAPTRSLSDVSNTPASPPAVAPATDVPPPINYSSRPTAAQPAQPAQAGGVAKLFDLQLPTLWFTAPMGQMQFPPDLRGYNHTYSKGNRGNEQFLKLAMRISEDLSMVKFTLTWQQQDALNTINVQRENVPPPRELSQQELEQCSQQFGHAVASWAESQMGQQVGDGECWTLAKEAIDHGTGKQAMSSQSYTHGALVYHINSQQGGAQAPIAYKAALQRGDIIQYKSVKLQLPNGVSRCGMPDHTAVITSANGANVNFVHQNTGGVKRVMTGQQDLAQLIEGDIKVFRPVWKDWAGELKL